MNTAELRTVALTLQQRLVAMEQALMPAYTEAAAWVLDSTDASLPTIGEVKAALLAYEAFEKPSLLLYEEVRAVKTDADPAVELPPFEGAADWDTMLNKPATFPPDTHAHAYADVTDKPATFSAKFTTVTFVGNGNATRTISYTPVIPIMALIGRRTDGTSYLLAGSFISGADVSTPGTIVFSGVGFNASGITYQYILMG